MEIQGRILAFVFGTPYTITSVTGSQEQFGYKVILSVQSILAKVQTTVLFGNDLYGLGLTSNFPEETIFPRFVNTYKNRPEKWAQLSQIPAPTRPLSYPQALPVVPPVATAVCTVLNSGWDPVKQYWIEFAGNYFLYFPLFKDWASEVIRDGPNYTGFVPSSGSNSGNGFSGSGGCNY